ncbi:MAG: GAF domain-containing protein [Chloroflexota bacterium]
MSRPPRSITAAAELVVEIAVATAGQADLEQILQTALDRLQAMLPFTGGSIALVEGDELVVRAAVGPFAAGALGQRLPRGVGRSWRVLEAQEATLLRDIEAEGGVIRNPAATGQLRSWLAVPLVRGGESIGLLEVDSTEPDAFEEADVPLIETVARALSGPVELSSLYARLQARERQQAAVAELGRVALQTDNLDALLSTAVELLAETLDVEHTAVYEVEADRHSLRMIAAHGLVVPLTHDLVVAPGTASQAGYTLATGGPVVLRDVATEGRFALSQQVRELGVVSGMSTPIGGEPHPFGVLSAHTSRHREFTADDVNFLVAVANIAATGVERTHQAGVERRAQGLRDAFIGVISHELRTPITTIYGSSKVLRRRLESLDPAARTQIVEDIEAEADRLQRLVEDLLVLSRAEGGAVEVASEPILIGRIVERAVAAERDRWPAHRFELEVQSNLPTVAGEETYVEQVVRNLLTNAAKYGGDRSTIRVRVTAEAGEVAVRVIDEGPGVDPAEIEKLFEVFYRSADAPRRASGSGIGLFVCRELVHAMGGRTWGRNGDDKGAEFGFSLPAFIADDDRFVEVAPES